MELYVRTQKREQEFKETVLQKLSASHGIQPGQLKDIVDKIYSEPDIKIEKFWRLVLKSEKKAEYKLELSKAKYLLFLEEAGFGTYKAGKKYT